MKRIFARLCILVSGIAVPSFGGSGPTVIADLARDWSNSVNGNNGWTYNSGDVPLPLQPSWFGFPAWAPGVSAPDLSPTIFQVPASPQFDGFDFNVGDIAVQSADPVRLGNHGIANVKWTSAAAGTLRISGLIWNADLLGARDNQFTLKLNGAVLSSGIVIHQVNTRIRPVVFSFDRTVQAGDVVELDIVKPSDPTATGTFAGVSLTISEILGTRILPQFASGGAWSTSLYFSAPPQSAASFPIRFIGDDGTPLNVPTLGGVSSIDVNIPPGGTVVLEAPNLDPPITGYVAADLPSGVTGYGIFRQSIAGRADQEAIAPFTPAGARTASFTWDDTLWTTVVVVANLSPGPNSVTFIARGPDGTILGSSVFIIRPNGKLASRLLALPGMAAVSGARGVLDIAAASGPIAVTALRFGGEAFTGIPLN